MLTQPQTRRRQAGMHSVEMAIVSSVFFMLLFAVLEVGRALFVWNLLDEGVRRGARLAAVCPVPSTDAIQRAVTFGGSFVAGLNATDTSVKVEYLPESGAPVIEDPVANFTAIRYVRVVISNFSFRFLIPLVDLSVTAPDFSATLPSESLGVAPFGFTSPPC
ncbi:TadE/TadG family type IV pilus assembly protein [Motiliproteus sp. SC1-56]|uniref:TadE/TadG family type IV pilus assembly protein n=1 Tax=Motiliproteus sp. SC1-56 TaxID=2799565 RepID=UPI001A8CE115|nr:TadE/TadG family type IV pilus assembly protein [Motiliproteus sp. SC1-56]